MRVVVLGATGFLGSNLVSALLRRGDHVLAFSPDRDRLEAMRSLGVETVEGDFLRPETLDMPLEGFDWMVHLASTTTPLESVSDPQKDAANLSASRELFRKAVEARVRRVLFSSSGGTVYGDSGQGPIDETAKTRPVLPYTKTKLAIESELMRVCDGTHTVPIILRFGNPYGPNQSPARGTGVVTAWLRAARDDQPIMVYGSRRNARDFFYVSDAVRAMLLSLEGERVRGTYNIGSGRATTLDEVLTAIEAVTGKTLRVVEVESRQSDVVRVIALDFSRARRDFGWQPQVSLEQGLRLTWEWVLAGEPFRVG